VSGETSSHGADEGFPWARRRDECAGQGAVGEGEHFQVGLQDGVAVPARQSQHRLAEVDGYDVSEVDRISWPGQRQSTYDSPFNPTQPGKGGDRGGPEEYQDITHDLSDEDRVSNA
jgi:hypothetical protein